MWVDNWFSNMKACTEPIQFGDSLFRTVEHAYQAAKFVDPAKISRIQEAREPANAKWLGKKWPVETPNWKTHWVQVMWELCVQKWTLSQHRQELLAHQGPVVEFNNWGDFHWGVVIRPTGEVLGGQDNLGRIITEIRRQIIANPKTAPQITAEFQLQPEPQQPELL
jgi:ribA/ribD-fused uncharacterized protein